jgi:aspartate/methionine/tyrosine aminotransferase
VTTYLEQIGSLARLSPESGIVELVNRGRGRPNLLPLWVGEGDLPTPDFISQAANDSLAAGQTFYTWQRGIPELREALSHYHFKHFDKRLEPDRFIATGSGMQAIQLAIRALLNTGDEALFFTPAWPNFAAAVDLAAGVAKPVRLQWGNEGWRCNIDAVRAAITPKTKVIFVNSPANPSGWTASADDLKQVLELARAHGLWIITDEIYNRFSYNAPRAPSFFDVMDEDDRIIFVNSFSKNWAMTGWRIGWVTIPEQLGQVFENLVQYSTSGVAEFIQRGAVAALNHGDAFVDMQVTRARDARNILAKALTQTTRLTFVPPEGAFYLYFKVEGWPDGRAAAIDLLDKTGLGLAPGTAFGAGTEEWLRLCFNRDLGQIHDAAGRIISWINDKI